MSILSICSTFLKAKGYEVGTSLVDDEKIDYCKEMMEKAEKLGKKLLLPVDTTIAKEFPNPIDAEIEVSVVPSNEIPADMMARSSKGLSEFFDSMIWFFPRWRPTNKFGS